MEREVGGRRDLSVSMQKANLYTFVISLPPTILLGLLFVAVWGPGTLFGAFTGLGVLLLIGGVVVGIVAHEAIHGLSWVYFGGKPLSAIKFGFQVTTFTPYAHCKEPMTARAYRIGAAMPGILLGIIPSAAGIATGNGLLMLFGLFFTFVAGGDALILWLIRRVDGDVLVEDHPENAGCYVYETGPGQDDKE